jgi:hypothetical protein
MYRALGLGLLTAALTAGCSGAKRVAVEGMITYDGMPIPIGTITFVPTFENGIKAGGRIENGHYELAADYGLFPGPHKVEIRWAKPTGKKYKNEFGEEFDRTQEGLPDKYHSHTTLTADIKPGVNRVDFNLEK